MTNPTCSEWTKRAIEHFKSGRATDEHWEIMASCLLVASETEGLDGDLDDAISALCDQT